MFWPRFKLTPQEVKLGYAKYPAPDAKRWALRRMYTGQLISSTTDRAPVLNFRCPRRVRVFAMTCSGDVPQFRITMQDSSGEQYIVSPCTLSALMGGYVAIPPAVMAAGGTGATGGYPNRGASTAVPYGTILGDPGSCTPFVFEPSIVLLGNQTLSIYGVPATAYDGVSYRVDITLHVWEFPGWPKSDKEPEKAA